MFGYWIVLQKPLGSTGSGHLYIEAVPADAAMNSRVQGPYLYSMADTRYDIEVEVAASQPETPGARYQTVGAVIDYVKSQAAENPLVTITESGTYLPEESAAQFAYTNWLTIHAAAGVNCTFARDAYAGDSANRIFTRSGPICYRNITFDMRIVTSVQGSINLPYCNLMEQKNQFSAHSGRR